MKLSWAAITAPVDVPVVDAANSPDAAGRSGPPCPPCCRPAEASPATWEMCSPSFVDLGVAVDLEPRGERRPSRPTGRTSRRRPPSPASGPSPSARRRRSGRTGSAGARPIWSRLVSPLGLESGWAELALRVPPPLVPIILIASWLANGPAGDRLAGTLDGGDRLGPAKGLDGALAHDDDGEDQGERQRGAARRRARGRPRSSRSWSTGDGRGPAPARPRRPGPPRPTRSSGR